MIKKYKILNEHFEKNTDTGLFIRVVEVNPIEGGPSEIIQLTVDSGEFTNTLRNGYHKKEK